MLLRQIQVNGSQTCNHGGGLNVRVCTAESCCDTSVFKNTKPHIKIQLAHRHTCNDFAHSAFDGIVWDLFGNPCVKVTKPRIQRPKKTGYVRRSVLRTSADALHVCLDKRRGWAILCQNQTNHCTFHRWKKDVLLNQFRHPCYGFGRSDLFAFSFAKGSFDA